MSSATRYHGEDKKTVARLAHYYYMHYRYKEKNYYYNAKFHSEHEIKEFRAVIKKYKNKRRAWKKIYLEVKELSEPKPEKHQ